MCAMKNSVKISGWARRYRTALRRQVEKEPAPDMHPALKLGREALDLGLETLDMALIHDRALTSLLPPSGSVRSRRKTIGRAKRFFDETTVPIDKTHRTALKANIRLGQLTRALRRRTAESTASSRDLKKGIARREAVESALEKSGKNRVLLLKESVRLQKLLRDRKRDILLAQEGERQKDSRLLRDEIAQLLLAINFKLMTLKTAVKADTRKLKKEIAETQRLVQQSSVMLNRFAKALGGPHET
jgi:hypothetical protein